MRVVKNPEERRGEILDTAERLFTARGYANTTINDILAAIGIAKGTFYYYYKSKEEVMDAIVMRVIDSQVEAVEKVADDEYLSVHEKLFSILMSLRAGGEGTGEGEARPDNAEMQQKSLVAMITHIGPVVARVIEQGKEEGIFATPYPRAMVEQLLLSLRILFDEGLFRWDEEERIDRARAFAAAMESSLGAAEGSFNYVAELLSGYPALMV